jgi:23S rRNA pseudouridine2604 synthase
LTDLPNAYYNMDPKRLNKFISDTGFCSRRDADELIEQGRVTVNGKMPVDPGMKVTPKDKVRIDDELLRVKQEKPVYLIFNKPANMSATSDMGVRDNVVRAINFPATLEPTAMLEREAEGIIFLSNDSDFVRNVKRADNKFEKEYVVSVDKMITTDFLQKISGGGVPVPGEERKNNAVSKETQTRFRITLKPGTDHYLKRMCESLGYKVVHLQRVGFGEFSLAKLPQGHWRILTAQEVISLTSLTQGGKAASRRTEEDRYVRPARGERTAAGDKPARGERAATGDRPVRGERAGARGGAGKAPARDGADRPGTATSRGSDGAKRSAAPRSGAGSSSRSSRANPYKNSTKPAAGKGAAPKSASKRSDAAKGGPKRSR